MKTKHMQQIRYCIIFFMIALAVSGITAFPVHTELRWIINSGLAVPGTATGNWLLEVWRGVDAAHRDYPFLFYGFDWLAFAHIMIALLFIGVYKDPVRNKWIIDWAMICCVCIWPLAFICGYIRNIPLLHIFIDCSFGVFGLIPLWFVRKKIAALESVC